MSHLKTKDFLDLFGSDHLFSAYDYKKDMPPIGNMTELKEVRKLNRKGYCVFFAVNRMKDGSRSNKNTTGIRAIWVDDDNPRKNQRKRWPLPPSIVVKTSAHDVDGVTKFKFQYYWLTETTNFAEFEHVMQTMIDKHGNDKGVRDLARVLRIPNFKHNKDLDNPFKVSVVGGSLKTHSWDKIKIAFPPAEEVKSSTKEKGKYAKKKAKESISKGDDYHGSLRDRAMELANRKLDTDEIIAILQQDMERVPEENRDKRWQDRFSEEHLFECANSAVEKISREEKPLKKIIKSSRKRMPVIPDELIFPDDIYGDFIRNVMESTEHRNNPVAAMVHGRGDIALACDGYGAKGNITPSSYSILLGDSLKGKTLTAKAARRFLPQQIHCTDRIITTFTNGEALENKFIQVQSKYDRPSILASIDEIGMNLNAVRGKSESSLLTHRILEIATNGLDPLNTRTLVSQDAVTLYSPRLVTCGNTTIAALKGAIKRHEVETGATNRQCFFNAAQDVTNKRANDVIKRKNKHLNRIKEIMHYSKISKVKNRCEGYREVIIDSEVDDWIFYHDKKMLENNKDNTLRGRHTELSLSWAMCRAVYLNYKEPVITMEIFKWAFNIIELSIRTIEHVYDVYLGDENETVEAERKLIERLEDNKGQMGKTEALKIHPYNKWDSRRKNDFIFQLEKAGIIEIVKEKTVSNQTKLIMRLIGE